MNAPTGNLKNGSAFLCTYFRVLKEMKNVPNFETSTSSG